MRWPPTKVFACRHSLHVPDLTPCPIPSILPGLNDAKAAIDARTTVAGIQDDRIFRAVNKGDRITGGSMTPQAVFEVVKQYAPAIGAENAPHDLRRTFAKLAHKGRAAVEQIQLWPLVPSQPDPQRPPVLLPRLPDAGLAGGAR